LDAVVVCLERSTRGAALTHAQEVAANILLAELIWGAVIMGGQTAYRLDVDGLRGLGQSGERHVLDHTLTQW
jgi:hypothetical protein